MSTITAIKSGDTVYVGTDSLVTNGYTISVLKDTQSKVWKTNDSNVIFGVSGYVRDINILSTSNSIIDDIFQYKNIEFKDVVTNIVPKIFKALEDEGRIKTTEGIKQMQSYYILAHKDKLFEIDIQGGVIEPVDDYVSIGCGFVLADGAFQAIHDNIYLTPQQKVVKILMGVCTKDANVNYPIRVSNTTSNEVIIIRTEEEARKFVEAHLVTVSIPVKDPDATLPNRPTIEYRRTSTEIQEDENNE